MNPAAVLSEHELKIQRDIEAVERLTSAPGILEILCADTGMGFAAVARVDQTSWVACAVLDKIGFGLGPGGRLDLDTTLCKEAMQLRKPIAFDEASADPVYRNHHTPRIYKIESYVSVPIVLPNGDYFGNLCAIDPKPAVVTKPEVIAKFEAFARLIGAELERARADNGRAAALRTEQANSQLREEFIAVLGHDLRNPLSAILSSAAVIVRNGQAVDPRPIAKRIETSVRRMSLLIDDVLDFARGRLGGGIGTRMAEEGQLGSYLLDVVVESRASYPDRRIDAAIENPPTIFCDRARLQQLLSNLLGNAILHGLPDSPIEVAGVIDESSYSISVSNYGKGISAENLGKVFQPYWRSETQSTSDGLGLGLHICSQIARAHGGRMDVTSVVDGLTTFVAKIPLRRTDPD